MTLFEAENLAINFGGIRAVDEVSFHIEPGEVFTIIGPNGAGKTTIFNLISRIYDPSAGRITFMGRDITRAPAHTIAGLDMEADFIDGADAAEIDRQIFDLEQAHRS